VACVTFVRNIDLNHSRAACLHLYLWVFCTISWRFLQWTQCNSELWLRHNKRGREDGKGKEEQRVCLACIVWLKTFFPFWFRRSCLHFNTLTVFCEPKELFSTYNADTRFNPHALLLEPKRNNFTSDSIQGRTGLSLRTCYRFAVFPSLPRLYL
jgi:hypothetical protein